MRWCASGGGGAVYALNTNDFNDFKLNKQNQTSSGLTPCEQELTPYELAPPPHLCLAQHGACCIDFTELKKLQNNLRLARYVKCKIRGRWAVKEGGRDGVRKAGQGQAKMDARGESSVLLERPLTESYNLVGAPSVVVTVTLAYMPRQPFGLSLIVTSRRGIT